MNAPMTTESTIRSAMHNLDGGIKASGTEDLTKKFLTLGEGIALMIEHPIPDGEIVVHFMKDRLITAYELTRASDGNINVRQIR